MDVFVNESKDKRKHKSPSPGEGHDNAGGGVDVSSCCMEEVYCVVDGPWSMYGMTRYPVLIHDFDHFLRGSPS